MISPTFLGKGELNADLIVKTGIFIGHGFLDLTVIIVEPLTAEITGVYKNEFKDRVWKMVLNISPELYKYTHLSSQEVSIVKHFGKKIPHLDKGLIIYRMTHDLFRQKINATYRTLHLGDGLAILDIIYIDGVVLSLIIAVVIHKLNVEQSTFEEDLSNGST